MQKRVAKVVLEEEWAVMGMERNSQPAGRASLPEPVAGEEPGRGYLCLRTAC